MKYFCALLLATLFTIAGCNPGVSQEGSENRPETQALLDSLVRESKIPGLNFSIILADGTSENYSSGFSDIEEEMMLTTDHVLFSGSIGKTYAVALLMQLVDSGKVNLSDNIADYFDDIEWLSRVPNINDITIEMLLKHTSGLPRWVMKPEVWQLLNTQPDKVWSYSDRFSFVFDAEPEHPAGEGWGYSDTNYLLIGMLIEEILGDYYYDILKDRVIGPMNLKETYPSDRRDIYNLSQGYSRLPEFFQIPEKVVEEGRYIFNPQMEWTGGGVASTTSDLAKWAGIYYRGELFSDSLLQRIINPGEDIIKLDPSTSYSMGSFIFETPNGTAFGHTGFVPGFNAIFAYYPDSKLSVAMQFNSDYAGTNIPLNTYLDRVVRLYLKEYMH